jgi:predicted PurR-regulated permease PerM
MGAVVVTLVAVVIMLIAAVGVTVLRLMSAVRQMAAALDATRQRLEPIINELQENGEIAGLEAAQLQKSLEGLRSGRNGQR